jgi:hypothetical protein
MYFPKDYFLFSTITCIFLKNTLYCEHAIQIKHFRSKSHASLRVVSQYGMWVAFKVFVFGKACADTKRAYGVGPYQHKVN